MSEAKHTTGPWSCFRHKYGYWQVTLPIENSQMRLGLFDGPEGVPGDTEEERAGNAKLIAEAPETAAERDALRAEVARLELERDLMRGRVQWLLEACKNELYGSGCSDDICNKHGDGCGDCCFDEMRRAVAKAEEKGE